MLFKEKPNQLIIIGGGFSIREGINKGLWDKLKNKFVIGCNYAYNWFSTATFYSWVDSEFYIKQNKDIAKFPLWIGQDHPDARKKELSNTIFLPSQIRYKRNLSGGIYKSCYDKETEILTDKGWKYFKDLDRTEKVATLNLDKNKVEYYKPNFYIEDDYMGDMIHEKGKRIDLLVTPNHRMLVKKSHHPESPIFHIIRAGNLKNKEFSYKKDFPYQGKKQKYFVLPTIITKQYCWTKNHLYRFKMINKKSKKINMDDWLEFLGWYLSEGCCIKENKGSYRIAISNGNKKYIEEIKSVISRMKYKITSSNFQKNCYTLIIQDKQLWTYLKNNCGKGFYNKKIPREFLNLSKNQLNILFISLIKGDGCDKFNQIVYNTASKQLADNIYELGLKLGYSPNLRKSNPRGVHYIGKQLIKSINPIYIINFAKTKYTCIDGRMRTKKHYQGKIYCVNVSNDIVYVRRKGKGCWCGNSLVGLFALSLAIYLLDEGTIWLLGFDFGEARKNYTLPTRNRRELNNVMVKDEKGKPMTHFYQNELTHRGIGKISFYNDKERIKRIFQPYANEKRVKIFNVSMNSKIKEFEKISYDQFFEKSDDNIYCQDYIRKYIKQKIKEIK